jgi:DNA-directed RNA polymerase specialized sigma24 family protein
MDTDLVVRAQRGDKVAFALLATEIANRFLAVARRILRDLDLAEDATQQALLAIWQDLPQLRDPARFEAWSYASSCAPATPRGGRNVAGLPTSSCCRWTSRPRMMA